MAANVDFIDEIVARRIDWRIKVRVMNLWNVPVKNSRQEIQSIEMVLIDAKNNKIGGTVQKSWIPLFIHLLEEGSTYIMDNLMVAQNSMMYKKTSHKFKLNFMRTTRVSKILADDIPHYSFDFVDFPTILSEKRSDLIVDVIGHIMEKDILKEREKDGRRSVLLDLVLQDNSGIRINCTLWGPYARCMHAYLEELSNVSSTVPVVVILQLARLTNVLGVNAVSSGCFGTKFFINEDIAEMFTYKTSLSPDQAGPSQQISPIMFPTPVSLHEEFLKTPKMTIADLIESTKECFGAVPVTVVDINTEKGWSYNSCNKCLKVVTEVNNHFYCETCRSNVTASPRFKLNLQVIHTTGSATFTLFNPLVVSFIWRSAEDLIRSSEEGDNEQDIPVEFNSFLGKMFLFKVLVADINIKRGWQTYTAKKLAVEDSIINDFLEKNKINKPYDEVDAELQTDLAKLEEDNKVIILDNDTPSKAATQSLSSEITPPLKSQSKLRLSSVEYLDLNNFDFSPDSVHAMSIKTLKSELHQPKDVINLDTDLPSNVDQDGMPSQITPPTKIQGKRRVSAMEPINLSEMEVSPESVTKMPKNNNNKATE